jgi:hypothetical protein
MARPATRDDHEQFCTTEGWSPARSARGGRVRHHATYELPLPDGRILRTRISRPVDATAYGPSLWSHILRDQLEVTPAEFWACVRDRVVPHRGAPTPPAATLPAQLVFLARRELGVTDAELAGMTRDLLLARLDEYWAHPPG